MELDLHRVRDICACLDWLEVMECQPWVVFPHLQMYPRPECPVIRRISVPGGMTEWKWICIWFRDFCACLDWLEVMEYQPWVAFPHLQMYSPPDCLEGQRLHSSSGIFLFSI